MYGLPCRREIVFARFAAAMQGWLGQQPVVEDSIIKRSTRPVNELRHKPPPFFPLRPLPPAALASDGRARPTTFQATIVPRR
ncbi:MAG: hypothetical protein ACKO5E_00850, partial [bacterium]